MKAAAAAANVWRNKGRFAHPKTLQLVSKVKMVSRLSLFETLVQHVLKLGFIIPGSKICRPASSTAVAA
jgi:hypothetical protein